MAQKPIKKYHSDAKKKKDEVVYNVVIMSPRPGKMRELEKLCSEGYAHHLKDPECLSWHITKSVDMQGVDEENWKHETGEGDLVLFHEWTSIEALHRSSQSDVSTEMRDVIGQMLTGPPVVKVSKTIVGFRREE